MTSKNLEIGIIGQDKIFTVLKPSEVNDYLQEVE